MNQFFQGTATRDVLGFSRDVGMIRCLNKICNWFYNFLTASRNAVVNVFIETRGANNVSGEKFGKFFRAC